MKATILSAGIIAPTLVASPALAQEATQEPAAMGFFYPTATTSPEVMERTLHPARAIISARTRWANRELCRMLRHIMDITDRAMSDRGATARSDADKSSKGPLLRRALPARYGGASRWIPITIAARSM